MRWRKSASAILAQKFGIDLTLLIEQLRLTPAERVRRMHDLCQPAEPVRAAASIGPGPGARK